MTRFLSGHQDEVVQDLIKLFGAVEPLVDARARAPTIFLVVSAEVEGCAESMTAVGICRDLSAGCDNCDGGVATSVSKNPPPSAPHRRQQPADVDRSPKLERGA